MHAGSLSMRYNTFIPERIAKRDHTDKNKKYNQHNKILSGGKKKAGIHNQGNNKPQKLYASSYL